jgi:hypothetical protein
MREDALEVPKPTLNEMGTAAQVAQIKIRRTSLAKRIREMVGDDPARIANILFDILEDPSARNTDRIAAAREIFDRGWGKAPAYAPIEGGDPLEESDLDKAIKDIADQLTAKRAHPTLEAVVIKDEPTP